MILGIDFSLTGTGVCAIQDGSAECAVISSRVEPVWQEFPTRVRGIVTDAVKWAENDDFSVFIESPAYGASGAALDRMFGGWWLVIDELRNHTDSITKVTPGQIKKFITGNGNANKDKVLAAAIRRYPDVNFDTNDEADALVLAAIGAGVHGEPFNGTLNKDQISIIDAIKAGRSTLK